MASFVTPGSFHQFMGWLGALLFGAYSLNFAWALLDTAQPVLTIAPDGIRDRRIASEYVAWNTVEKLSIFGARVGSRSLVVQIPTSGWQGLSLTLMARWERLSNRSFGIDGLMVRTSKTSDLEISFEQVVDIVDTYAKAHGAKVG